MKARQTGTDLFAQPGLFGDVPPGPSETLRALEAQPRPPLDELDAAAEWLALRSGRPKSQERAELVTGRGASYATHTGEYATADDAGPPPASDGGPCARCGDAGAFYDGSVNGGEYAILCACGAAVDSRRGFRFEGGDADDDFEDEDGPEYVDVGADPDAAWSPDELLDESAGNDDAQPEPAPVCGECKISATIHEWAAPHGRDGFPCPPGSWQRDRAAFEASIVVGDQHNGFEVSRVAYSPTSLGNRPEWCKTDTLRGDVQRYPVTNCYGTLWVERRRARADLFSAGS